MATIVARKNADGRTVYKVVVRRKGIPTQTATFRTRRDAQQQFPPCPKDPIRPMPEGSPGASFGSQKPCVTLPSKREAKRGAIPCNVGFPFG